MSRVRLSKTMGGICMGRFLYWLNRKKRIREKDVGSVAWLVRILMSVGLEVRIEQYSQKERFYFEDDCR